MSRQMRNDKVIGGTSNNASAILYEPADTSRSETNVEAELDRIDAELTDIDKLVVNKTDFTDNTAIDYSYTITKDGLYDLRMTIGKKSAQTGFLYIYKNGSLIYRIQSSQYEWHMEASMLAKLVVGDVIKFQSTNPVDGTMTNFVQIVQIR